MRPPNPPDTPGAQYTVVKYRFWHQDPDRDGGVAWVQIIERQGS
jgi:hypothetical protein